jgi:hypothetical protein
LSRQTENRVYEKLARKKSNISVAQERMSALLSEDELRAVIADLLEASEKVIQVCSELIQSASHTTATDNLNENQTNEAT